MNLSSTELDDDVEPKLLMDDLRLLLLKRMLEDVFSAMLLKVVSALL